MWAAAARWSFSHRRAFLITVGAGWALYGGLGIIGNPRYGTARGLADVTRYVPMDVLGWMWVACGAVAALAGLLVNCPRVQALGYTLLAVPAGLWSGAFAASAATSYPEAVGSACGWGAFTIGVVLVSGMDDPPPPYLRKDRR
ncbi:hypothetical protein [Streptomyces griseorubiginosus]|uniref:hypothetical protein n=1 Tax=Streptomyces griseorubiginosus TaxID=67304 RepID=UPI002E80DBBB|nr:hypothetical protein [Streptomyces griseorubiginosus]WUB45340.1 hypothetical protein OHN19_19095 [Streptomyces griseorubiginosus]WUB53857.1 hypothetical protein OG942_19090 [Streptomyces griseorubiginosus]